MLDLGQYLCEAGGISVVGISPVPMTSMEKVVLYRQIARDLKELLIGQPRRTVGILHYRRVARFIHTLVARLETTIENIDLRTEAIRACLEGQSCKSSWWILPNFEL